MPTYYVGPGGNDGNTGLSWAQRKLTLNGAEDIPVAAGDTVYVGPGVYRETLTVDVSGAAGSPITYVGDVYGEHTDGVGGVVRITGSDDDMTATRQRCVNASAKNYRTFRGLQMDSVSQFPLYSGANGTNWILEDCAFRDSPEAVGFWSSAAGDPLAVTVRRCLFMNFRYRCLEWQATDQLDSQSVVENCLFISNSEGYGAIRTARIGGIKVNNCTFIGCNRGVNIQIVLPVGYTPVTVSHCTFAGVTYGVSATALGEIVENYNNFCPPTVSVPRQSVAIGANSTAYITQHELPLLFSGQVSPWWIGQLSQWSALRAIAGDGTETADDLYGITKPVTAAKRSWGAIQYRPAIRDTATTYNASAASLELPDAGEHALQFLSQNVATVVTCRVYREANYAGTNPQLIIRQAGQADTTVTDVGAAGAWNLLTANLTPVASPGWCSIILKSNNTAAAGNYACYFDAVEVG